ncbi:MAG TPA: methyltransferase domain-containing protein [Candidatus Binatia bacterium]|nr:methyltransferase domain-containing protein [Candidatus Binatia bacterium]
MKFRRIVYSALLLVFCALRADAQQSGEPNTETKRSGATTLRSPDVVYVPTPMDVVEAMLRVAKAGKGDVVYDLGSGDGRIPIMAVQKFNVDRAIGIDINPERIREAELNASTAGVSNRVRFSNEDLFAAKIGEATVVTLYLLSSLNLKLLPKLLEELKPGTRVVSHAFDMGSWKPRQALQVNGSSVYFWVIPAKGTAEYKAAMAAAAKAKSG